MSFDWDRSFETGLDIVDEQHHVLVDLINEVAPGLTSSDALPAGKAEELLDRLAAYAATHFRTEEGLMQQYRVDARHVATHAAEHAHFAAQIASFRAGLSADFDNALGPRLLAYLVHWLSFHILDEDQRMARQIDQIRAGSLPSIAYEMSFLARNNEVSRAALIAALSDLYSQMSERRRTLDEAHGLVGTDALTGLHTRPQFLDGLVRACADALATDRPTALMVVGVDRDGAGRPELDQDAIDRVLASLGERLRRSSRRSDLCGRTAGDEVAIALADGADVDALHDVARRLYAELSEPIGGKGAAIPFALSAGIAFLPEDARDGDHLLAAAQLTLDAVRRGGGGACRRFEPNLGEPVQVRSSAVIALRNAIRKGELVLHYQPQVSLRSGEIVGLEALVRWQHPEKGLIAPGQFIPLAEETGLIVPLGEWVLREAMQQLRVWRALQLSEVRVAVNLSARHFRVPRLAETVAALLAELQVPPHLLELELTESVMMHDPAAAIRVVGQVKDLGVKLSLDDFGTGYSSLTYLSRFAFDRLKIDQSFVRDITMNPVNASIASATIAMAHKLGKETIAEGVETDAQMLYLRRHDCDEMQGFLFCRPQPPDVVGDLLRSGATQSFGTIDQSGSPCLLLVDDEVNILNALKRLLRREGYRILAANSAPKALELLAANDVDVVLSDQRMPDMSGSELMSRVKDMYPDTVRMILSGYADLSAVTDAVNRGAIFKFLSKPWKDDELKMEIRMAFRRHRELRARRREPAGRG